MCEAIWKSGRHGEESIEDLANVPVMRQKRRVTPWCNRLDLNISLELESACHVRVQSWNINSNQERTYLTCSNYWHLTHVTVLVHLFWSSPSGLVYTSSQLTGCPKVSGCNSGSRLRTTDPRPNIFSERKAASDHSHPCASLIGFRRYHR